LTRYHSFVYGIIPTLQPADFGRVYAAYRGVFFLSSIVWCRIVDKKKPDRYEIIGSIVAVVGALIIFRRHVEAFFIQYVIVHGIEIRCADRGCLLEIRGSTFR
jgi:hypothetical protein